MQSYVVSSGKNLECINTVHQAHSALQNLKFYYFSRFIAICDEHIAIILLHCCIISEKHFMPTINWTLETAYCLQINHFAINLSPLFPIMMSGMNATHYHCNISGLWHVLLLYNWHLLNNHGSLRLQSSYLMAHYVDWSLFPHYLLQDHQISHMECSAIHSCYLIAHHVCWSLCPHYLLPYHQISHTQCSAIHSTFKAA